MTYSDSIDPDLERLVDRADLDELVRRIDDLCATRDWDSLFRLRTLTRSAITTGRQVWPATTLAEYRLALLAPAMWASRVLSEDSSRFSIGPLTEVIAQNHSWTELAEHLEFGPQRAFVAYERAIRGEAIAAEETSPWTPILDIPVSLEKWEPAYQSPTYRDNGVDHPCPSDQWVHNWQALAIEGNTSNEILDDEQTDDALRRLVEPWTANSAGRARSVVVEGDEAAACAALDLTTADRIEIAPLTAEQAIHWLVWCGASGGVHGRRRGMASGRFGTWWLLAALGGVLDDWDQLLNDGELSATLAEIAHSLSWSRWRTSHRYAYELSLLAHDKSDDITIALSAYDDAFAASVPTKSAG